MNSFYIAVALLVMAVAIHVAGTIGSHAGWVPWPFVARFVGGKPSGATTIIAFGIFVGAEVALLLCVYYLVGGIVARALPVFIGAQAGFHALIGLKRLEE